MLTDRVEKRVHRDIWECWSLSLNSCFDKPEKERCLKAHLHDIHFGHSTAFVNFGTRAKNMGHGRLDFCRVKANFSAPVPKNLGGPKPPQEVVSACLKRGPRAETGGIYRSLPSWLTRRAKPLGSKISFQGTKILYFSREKKHGVEKLWQNLLLEQRC